MITPEHGKAYQLLSEIDKANTQKPNKRLYFYAPTPEQLKSSQKLRELEKAKWIRDEMEPIVNPKHLRDIAIIFFINIIVLTSLMILLYHL